MTGYLRLISGLVLFLFVLGHLVNHALGIISLRAMNDALKYTIQPWRDPFGEALLILALVVHVGLALLAVYKRRSIKMRSGDAVQLVTGFLIPIFLAGHILGTRGIHEVYGVVEGYEFTLYGLWINSPFNGVMNAIALLIVWVHSCLGWHYWLRLKPWYVRIRHIAFSLAILMPALALAGYVSAGFRVLRLSRSEKWVDRLFVRTADKLEEMAAYVNSTETIIWLSVIGMLLATLLARAARLYTGARRAGVLMRYRDIGLENQLDVALQPGASVLDMLRASEIRHASVCGGRGRCSTCRVRIDTGLEHLPPPNQTETRVLGRIGATPDIRLACQLVPNRPLTVTALLRPDVSVQDARVSGRVHQGEEQNIAILFADIRGFTKLTEDRLPYDTAFLLNRYFAAMGQAIEESGGHVDKFIGDGVMALFGIDETMEQGCARAIRAATAMSARLKELNAGLKDDLDVPLRIGIGIHSGTAIVGNMGYNRARSLTAIGDVVNTASRLEALTKEFAVQLVVSERTVQSSGINLDEFASREVAIRGREEPLTVRLVSSAADISA